MRQTLRIQKTGGRGEITREQLSTAAAVSLFFSTTARVLAQTAFEGKLNRVSITGSTGTNSPPTANITYTQNGDTIVLDASGSSDSDCVITQYKWDFVNGNKAEGQTTNFLVTDSSIQVTLTVEDNNNAIALFRKM